MTQISHHLNLTGILLLRKVFNHSFPSETVFMLTNECGLWGALVASSFTNCLFGKSDCTGNSGVVVC